MAKFCGFCGARSEGGTFCTSCGNRLPGSEPEAAPSPYERPVEPPVAEPVAQPVAEPFVEPVVEPVAEPVAEPVVAEETVVRPPVTTQLPTTPPPAPAPVLPPSPATPPPATPPAPTWRPGPEIPAPAPVRPAGPRTPVVNPFAGVPVGDYVRDAAAAVCLFATLGKPWDLDGDGTDHWWVILSVLVAVASLAVPYLAKSGAVPGLGRDQAQLLKLAANAPIVICVVAAIVNDLVHATDFLDGGIGPGVALALAGAFFAAQPRAADEDLAFRDDGRWWAATSAFIVVAVGIVLAEFTAFVLRDLTGDAFLLDEPAELMSLIVAPLLLVLALYGGAAREAVARHFHGVLVFATVGLTATAVALLTGDTVDGVFNAYSGFNTVERWDSAVGGIFALSGAGALALSRPSLRTALPAHPVTGWLQTARLAFLVVAAGAFLVPVSLVLSMVAADSYPAAAIADVVMWAVIALVACMIVSLLSGSTLNRLVVVSLAALVPVVGIVLVAVGRSSDDFNVFLGAATALLFTLPGLALCALTIPRPIRHTYGPLLPERTAVAGQPPPS